MTRDIDAYTKTYTTLPFEPVQAYYRRKMVLAQIAELKPRTLLEIGCGEAPLFTSLPVDIDVTVVEPSIPFAQKALELAEGRSNIYIHNCPMEDFTEPKNFDVIILSSLLHEVLDPQQLLAAVFARCGANTLVHVNVPNARSVHRLLGIILGIKGQSGTQKKLQQHRTPYDHIALEAELNKAGFTVINRGGMLIKPLTHIQMQALVNKKLLTYKILDWLDRLAMTMPSYASEIWVTAKVSA
jgi:2-polyprenyl-3-methyl-5-hydroxy-6-metoxy-1,4-benzoquinol methylase